MIKFQLSLLCPEGSVGRVGEEEGLVEVEHLCIVALQPGEVVVVVRVVDRHLESQQSHFLAAIWEVSPSPYLLFDF